MSPEHSQRGERWEYRIVVVPATKPETTQLNDLGHRRWELPSAVGVGEFGAIDEVWLLLKRRVE